MTWGVTILLAAAGASSRMRGSDKMLERITGRPLLTVLAERALVTGCPVLVALPPDAGARRAALAGLPVKTVTVHHADLGMGESLRRGAARVAPDQAMMVMLGDMPEIQADDLTRLLDAYDAENGRTIVRACSTDGTPGHPVIFPPDLLPCFADLRGDTGARSILKAQAARIRPVALPDRRALTDLDTPEDWAAWREQNG
ncbi:nucleotidyltransferase family protein [Oceaniglobus indicus]|uniref:nucleotidyltransferase family protein n=1 Tax=Oceaniglobus indicus TaxID=2047749 RepID=UPI000C1A5883|nr:nucleotidyltransferase family protein [Oceaniglobus indicus]